MCKVYVNNMGLLVKNYINIETFLGDPLNNMLKIIFKTDNPFKDRTGSLK